MRQCLYQECFSVDLFVDIAFADAATFLIHQKWNFPYDYNESTLYHAVMR